MSVCGPRRPGPLAAVAPRSGHGGGRWGVYCPAIHRQIASTT